MLNVMRENLKSLKWILWLVAIAMTLYLGSFFFDSGSSSRRGPAGWAARVDGSPISVAAFRSEARGLDNNYRQLLGTNYEQLKSSIRIGNEAIQRLVSRKLILDDARRLGLEATDEDIAERIRGDTTFHDAAGQFIGTERYVQYVLKL